MILNSLSLDREDIGQSTLSLSSIDGEYGSQSASHSSTQSGGIPDPKKARLPDGMEEHKEFCEHALDVSRGCGLAKTYQVLRRHSQANDLAIPDVSCVDTELII
jgi:hypothetical protein